MTTRSAVLAAAALLIDKDGFAGLSVREAARRAGVSHNAPYAISAIAIRCSPGWPKRAGCSWKRHSKGAADASSARPTCASRSRRFRLMFRAGAQTALLERFAAAFEGVSEPRIAGLAAWSLVHGIAELAINGCVGAEEVPKILGAMRFAVQRSA